LTERASHDILRFLFIFPLPEEYLSTLNAFLVNQFPLGEVSEGTGFYFFKIEWQFQGVTPLAQNNPCDNLIFRSGNRIGF
jgi:hypothetical protein